MVMTTRWKNHTFKCEPTIVEPHADQDVPRNPFLSTGPSKEVLDDGNGYHGESPVRASFSWSPRRIAEELMTLQMQFVAAHERQVRELQKLVSASEVNLVEVGSLPGLHDKATRGPVLLATQHPRAAADEKDSSQADVQPPNRGECIQNMKKESKLSMSEAEVKGSWPLDSSLSMGLGGDSGQCQFVADEGPCTSRRSQRSCGSILTRTASWKEGVSAATIARATVRDMPDDVIGAHTRELSFCRSRQSFADAMHSFTEQPSFDLFCGAIIVANAIFMAYETEHALSAPPEEPQPAGAVTVGRAFTAWFVLELILRMCGGLQRFFCSCSGWNYFDLCIVTLAASEELFQEAASLSNTRMIRLLRLTRAMKIMRTARIVRMIGALSHLVNSLAGTVKQIVWAFFLIVCIVFIFAVLFGQMVCQGRADDEMLRHEESLLLYWGSLSGCMYTLYMSVTGGVSWIEVARPLEDLGTPVLLGFMLYLALIQWVVLNVITACFCESAAEAARKDLSLAMQSHRADRDYFLDRCKQIFRAIDMDGSGTVRVDEMGPYLETEPARALFSALGVDLGEVYEVFELLDEDGDESINLEEFMWGLMQLRGGASALSMLRIQHQNKKISSDVRSLADALCLKL
eukprot:TRINITY_DN130_c0_g3_i1.p1 TRINITY_DN130_c0_g3~~TRINITY_DN130_c0_g3_i1.p1  ORF type:complete len:631 (-),score=85.63 TRINITY_DN130_c0_g3_i1:460-2352(-)